MKRSLAVLVALALILGLALAEGVDAVNTYVERQGYKFATARSRARISGCWLTEDQSGDTLQWSDRSNTYTVTTKSGKGLRTLYGQIIGMGEWDTCSYTFDGRVQFAYNAPDTQAVKSYKTLNNYVKYVSAYIDENPDNYVPETKAGRQSYIVNKSSKKFHRPDCSTIKQMKSANKEKFTGTRDQLIQMGYEPCKVCDP